MIPPPSEEALLQAARQGDPHAFDQLVERYQGTLYRLMVRACHHPQDAEEVASEAFLRAYQKLALFEGRSSFVSWLGRIATNLCFRRREKPELDAVSLDAATGTDGPHALDVPDREPGPERLALQAAMRAQIRAAVAALPEPEQTVFRLRDIEQMTARETAERTGLTVPAVKARLHRARGRLRDALNAAFLAE